jgi:hypothetical protein
MWRRTSLAATTRLSGFKKAIYGIKRSLPNADFPESALSAVF